MNKVNPNEAPEGYVAVYQGKNLCTGCSFSSGYYGCNQLGEIISCVDSQRKDKQTVIFIKNQQPIHTSASDFTDAFLKDIANDCGFTVGMQESSLKNNMQEIELFASKVFEAGVKFGKEQANGDVH